MSDIALICESDPDRAAMYRALVVDEGFGWKIVTDGAAALAAARTRPPVLVLTELSLPKVDGFSFLTQLRAQLPDAGRVVLVVSAFRELRDVATKQKDALGITALLGKSSPLATVQRVLRAALGRHGSARVAVPMAPEEDVPLEVERFPAALVATPEVVPETKRSERQLQAQDLERRRLARIDGLGLTRDQPMDAALQTLVTDAARAFGVPIALVTLMLEDRQVFKAHVGLTGWLAKERGTPRDWSFCRHVVEGRQPLIVPDAATHPFFASNPLVREGLVRSYAGVPLETADGHVLGSLCLIDQKPLAIDAAQVRALGQVARRAAGEIELHASRQSVANFVASMPAPLRAEALENAPLLATLASFQAVLDCIDDGITIFDAQRRIQFVNRALCEWVGLPASNLRGMSLADWGTVSAPMFDQPEEQRARIAALPDGPFALRELITIQKPKKRVIRWVARPVALPDGVGQLCVYTDVTTSHALRELQATLGVMATDLLTPLEND